MFVTSAGTRKPAHVRIRKHVGVLMWKSYTQRKRRWGIFLLELLFATLMFLLAGLMSRSVFLTPLRSGNLTSLDLDDTRDFLSGMVYIGYAPSDPLVDQVMGRFSRLLRHLIRKGNTEDELNDELFKALKGKGLQKVHVIWILWETSKNNEWRVKIRSSERAKKLLEPVEVAGDEDQSNQYLTSGFLAVQMALCEAIVEHNAGSQAQFKVRLKTMPTSPLMREERVKNTLAWILLCLTLALMPPVIETEALVVTETAKGFKRAMRMRHVDFSSIYAGWMMYAYISALPVCLMGGVFLIFVFRWINLTSSLAFVLAYETVMIMLAMLMALFHKSALSSCVWSLALTLLQTFMAELLVHHAAIAEGARSIVLHLVVPPLGLVNGLNQFALLQVGQEGWELSALSVTITTWVLVSAAYFALLMLLQRTMGRQRSVGGQVSWKSIIFKKPEDPKKLHPVEMPTGKERDQLQEVDELLAKAISFHSVSKRTMGHLILKDITFDIYRGEYTMLYAKTVQHELIMTLENIITGLTLPDEGYVTTLGYQDATTGYLAVPHMLGYCHNSKILLEDLTVEEHLKLFMQISTCSESLQNGVEYKDIRSLHLLNECDLIDFSNTKVEKLSLYHKAQLCWALALLLEPRIVFIPHFIDKHSYVAVITDKIMRYRNHLTIVQTCDSSMHLENADRVFIFDSKTLVFGGTMPYFFFKYGREYRLRLVIRGDNGDQVENMKKLKETLIGYGASVRAHFGSLLIMRVPLSPTTNVVSIIEHLERNSARYGLTPRLHLTLPDSEEVCTRAIASIKTEAESPKEGHETSGVKEALERIKNETSLTRSRKNFFINLVWIRKKFESFHIYYRFFFILTIVACLVAGVFIGRTLGMGVAEMSEALRTIREPQANKEAVLTAEALPRRTTFALRSDNATESLSVTNAYTFSNANLTSSQLSFFALSSVDSLIEYLRIGATLEPQKCVIKYAYGMDVFFENNIIHIDALYSPLHLDKAASARSLGRAYQALLRHYTGALDALIEIEDQPLFLDITPVKVIDEFPQLLIPSLVLLTVSHVTLLPSHEYGFLRHMQNNARNFSPFQYWTTLWIWDLVTYALLVVIMTLAVALMIVLISPWIFREYIDLAIVPALMIMYGFGSIPQAYLFSLSPHPSLNIITYIIVNIVFGESTVMTRMFTGATLDCMLFFIYISPQFNFAFALVKITKIFIYNTECLIVDHEKYCEMKIIHKCCEKCGLILPCFKRKNYLSFDDGVLHEMILIVTTAGIFFCLLMLWEYRYIKRWLVFLSSRYLYPGDVQFVEEDNGAAQEKRDVLEKAEQIKHSNAQLVNTFGECLLVNGLSDKRFGRFVVKGVCLGLRKGEALAVSGHKRHGRVAVCDLLSGYRLPSEGDSLALSRWSIRTDPHKYSKEISMCCARPPLPQWMTVTAALQLIAVLRGVPEDRVKDEVWNYIEALELTHEADAVIYMLPQSESRRLHFAAAMVGAPPVVVLDECTAYQPTSVHRSMYRLLHHAKRRGHALLIASARVEGQLPVTDRLAFLMNGHVFDMDYADQLIENHSRKGYTVAVHLKDEVDIGELFKGYFDSFVVNDTTEVLVNIQVLDNIPLLAVLTKMERLAGLNPNVYTYIVTTTPLDYIYNTVLSNESWNIGSTEPLPCCLWNLLDRGTARQTEPSVVSLEHLKKFPKKYNIMKLVELPWSVIFQR